jgi:hypothetical protein
MRELIGYLDAFKGAGGADARTAAVIPQQFLCNQFLCKKLLRKDDRAHHALIDRAMIDHDVIDALIKDEEWIGADIAIGRVPSVARTPTGNDLIDGILTHRAWAPRADSARNGSPITIFYAREKFTDDAVEEIARAIPCFGVFD